MLDDPQLEQEARIRILSGLRMLGAREQARLRIALGEVEPALLECAAVGTIDGLEGERRRTGQRMLLDPDRIVDAVELDRFAERRVDDPGVAFDGRFEAADVLEAIEGPDDFSGPLSGRHRGPADDEQRERAGSFSEDHRRLSYVVAEA